MLDGVKATSGEVWAATKEGLQTVRSVRRIPVEELWNENNEDFVKHVSWNKSGEDPEAYGYLPGALEGATATGAAAAGSMDLPRVIVVNTKEVAPGDFYIKKKDVEAYGHTKGCPCCRTMFQGCTRQAYTTEWNTMEKCKEYEEETEEERRMEMKNQRREEKKAEKRGQNREADGDAMEEESAKRGSKAEEEEARGEKMKAEDEELHEHEEAGGDGTTIEAVLKNDEAWTM